jgi:Fe-S-cluster-containing dehydrogenase component/DMSO reductase anchor subunit
MTTVLATESVGAADEPTPIDVWLARQQDLTAVERFAAHHDADTGTRRWTDRLPATGPGPGQQYGFEVDLDACTGCKACVAACHGLNGLDDDEAWRRVGSLHGTTEDDLGSVTVTSACHHCVEPACLEGCPASAYEKDPVTGIVRHLDDACIGCSYCTLTCPYEVPVYNPSLGIVRKCDMCSDRLADGEAPACVQGCPQGAITIAIVTTEELLARTRTAEAAHATLVPTAPRSAATVPATTYRSSRPLPETWVASDGSSIHPSHGHTPLAVMLVLTQAAVGMMAAASVLRAVGELDPTTTSALAGIGLATGLVALAASTLHLGRPLLAWRAVLGIRRSWLSREIVAFGAFAGLGIADGALGMVGAAPATTAACGVAAVVGGVLGVGCSVRLYAVTGRRWWRTATTAVRFGGTTLACGALATAAVVAAVDPAEAGPTVRALIPLTLVGLAASVLAPLVPLRRGLRRGTLGRDLAGTRRLLGAQLQPRFFGRLAAAVLAICLLGAAASALPSLDGGARGAAVALALSCVALLAGEYLDRRLFFLASVAPRMPGSPR